MENTVFASCIGRIKSLENKMIDKSKIESLIEAKDFSDAVRMLQDTRYGEYINEETYEEGLKHYLEDLYRDMYKTCPVREVVDILALRYDALNIKSLIKGKFAGIESSALLIDAGVFPAEKLKAMVREENFRDLPETVRGVVENAYENYKNTQSPQEIDLAIDKGMFQYMLKLSNASEFDYLAAITKLMIDTANIKSFIRVKVQDKNREFLREVFINGGRLDFDLFVNSMNDSLLNFPLKVVHTDYYKWVKNGIDEYERTGNLGAVDKSGDNYIIEQIKKSKLISFGPEPVIAYILAVENEIRSVRIILTGKKNGVRPDLIRERLRDSYV